MSGQYRIKRRIAQVPIAENGVVTVDLPRGYDYESLAFRIYGNVNVTTAFAGAVRAEAPCQLIKRIELVADGKNTIDSIPFVLLSRGNVFRRGQLGSLTPPTSNAIATYPIEATAALDMGNMDGIRSKDSNLRTNGMSLLQLRFTFGQTTDLFVAGAGAGNISAMYVDIFSTEMIEQPDPATGKLTTPLYLVKRTYQDIAILASNANQQIILPIGNILRGVVIRAEGDVTAGEPSNNIVNNIQLASGIDVRFNMPGLDCRALNKLDYQITTLPNGIYVVDMMSEGGFNAQASEGWDLTHASEAKLLLDVVGGANVKLTIETIELIQ